MKIKKILTLLLSCFMILTLAACSSTDKGYFEGLEWGKSLNDINNSTKRVLVATAEGNAKSEDTTPIENLETKSIMVTDVTYMFTADKLCEVVVNAEPSQSYNSFDALEEIKAEFTEKYTFKKQEANTYRWETEQSVISVTAFDSRIIITYSQKTAQ